MVPWNYSTQEFVKLLKESDLQIKGMFSGLISTLIIFSLLILNVNLRHILTSSSYSLDCPKTAKLIIQALINEEIKTKVVNIGTCVDKTLHVIKNPSLHLARIPKRFNL